jgi:hypothetical protein
LRLLEKARRFGTRKRRQAVEELFVIVVGAGALLLMPLVPALRPAVKTIVKGGMAFMNATKIASATASEQWHSIVKEAEDELASEHQATAAAPDEVPASEQPGLEAAPALEG